MGNKAAKPETLKVDQQQNRMELLDGLVQKSITIFTRPYFAKEKQIYKGKKPKVTSQISRSPPLITEGNKQVWQQNEHLQSLDNRSKISEPNSYPYSAIGYITFKDEQVYGQGTGFLIGKNIVLTAASNLYNNEKKKRMKGVVFWLCANGKTDRAFVAKRTFWPDQFIPNVDNKYNYGVIQLGQDLQDQYGYFGLDFQEPQKLQGEIAGYPETIYNKNMKEKAQRQILKEKSQFTQILEKPGIISSDINTSRGQCGSPIFWSLGQNSYVVGIHTSEGEGKLNEGVLLTKQVKERIGEWAGDNKKKLNLQGMNVTGKELQIVLDKYKKIVEKLNTLQLQGNIIGCEGAKYLASMNFRNLLTLSLGSSKIGLFGAKYLSEGKFQSLTTLNLEQNEIGPEGAKYIAQGNFENLLTLNLQWNNIGPEGAQYLAQGRLNQLTTLYLSYNKIEYLGAIFLAHSKLFNLSKVDLEWNNIEDSRKNEIRLYFAEGRIAEFQLLL